MRVTTFSGAFATTSAPRKHFGVSTSQNFLFICPRVSGIRTLTAVEASACICSRVLGQLLKQTRRTIWRSTFVDFRGNFGHRDDQLLCSRVCDRRRLWFWISVWKGEKREMNWTKRAEVLADELKLVFGRRIGMVIFGWEFATIEHLDGLLFKSFHTASFCAYRG